MKKHPIFALALAAVLMLSVFAGCGGSSTPPSSGNVASTAPQSTAESPAPEVSAEPVKLTMTYPDNATLPFTPDWLTVQEAQKLANAEITFEPIPIADYQTKVSLAINSNNPPDVILYQTVTKGEVASAALNGAIVPISDYADWTPNFNKTVSDFDLESDVGMLNLMDGKRYFLPAMFDKPFYDGGLIIRDDLVSKYGMPLKTYDDLYNILKKMKEENPSSYPLTTLVEPRVLYRMTMPSFGISLGQNASTGTWVLSYDYDKQEYFAGAISQGFKDYVTYFAKLFKEGLLDPEMINANDAWASKLATGSSMASFAYYDQIGGVVGNSDIEGISFNLYPPLEGSVGAHHQPKSKTAGGPMFPTATSKRDDFEQVVRAVDTMFFSPEAATLWCLGVEGTTYTMDGDKIKYTGELVNSAEGVYKTLQLKYGAGCDPLQLIWVNAREMTKYDDNYAEINKAVAAMPNAIQPIPPIAMFDDMQSEQAGLLQKPLADAFEIWVDAFITGSKSVDADWDAYVAEMQSKQIDEFCKLYNDNMQPVK